MPQSMTGFGRAPSNAKAGKLIAEIQSVNRKYLEVFVSMPKEYSRFEHEVRKWVSEKVGRGQITVRIHLVPGLKAIEALLPDPMMLQTLKKGWQRIAQQIGYEPSVVDFSFLVQQIPPQTTAGLIDEEELTPLYTCVDEALEALIQMKKKEGKALSKDLSERLLSLKKFVEEISLLSPEATQRMREKLKERMGEVFPQMNKEIEERLFREIALFAEKIDVTEELIRLASHFDQFQELLAPSSNSVGRKMDFLIQEMGREVNTISAKSADIKISRITVEIKSDLEKMREQVQNIE